MRNALLGLSLAILLLAGVGWLFTRSSTTGEGQISLSDGTIISYRIISEGGALGNERYEAFAERNGKRRKIFEAIGGQGFRVNRTGPYSIRFRLCDGAITHLASIPARASLSPIAIGVEDCPKAERKG